MAAAEEEEEKKVEEEGEEGRRGKEDQKTLCIERFSKPLSMYYIYHLPINITHMTLIPLNTVQCPRMKKKKKKRRRKRRGRR